MRRQIVAIALAVATTWAAEVSPVRLDQQVQAFQSMQKFNGAVLVVHKGIPVLNKGYGMANFEWNIPVTPATKFRLGSITKQFSAMCVLMLEQQGKLKVDEPVSKYFAAAPASWQNITIYHLLTHSSGIYNFTALPDYTKTMMLKSPPAESLKRVMEKPLEFDPGTKFKYSNSGYILLGAIIEKASGQSYEEYLTKNILQPLGMTNTGFDDDRKLLPQRAAGYEREGQVLRNAAFIDMSIPHAAGSLYSTTEDLWKWDKALSAGKLLPQALMDRYFTPYKDNYAYGWSVTTIEGKKAMSHGGGINGFATMIQRIPEEQLLVVTLSNVLPSDAGRLANELTQLVLGKEVAVPKERTAISVKRELLEQYVGEYPLTPTFVMTVSLDGDQLMTQATGQGRIPIFPESETKFFPKVVDATITFQKDAEGKVTGLVLSQNGRDMPAKKTK